MDKIKNNDNSGKDAKKPDISYTDGGVKCYTATLEKFL